MGTECDCVIKDVLACTVQRTVGAVESTLTKGTLRMANVWYLSQLRLVLHGGGWGRLDAWKRHAQSCLCTRGFELATERLP